MSTPQTELEILRAKNTTLLAALQEAAPVVEKLQEMIAKHHPGFTLRQTAIVRDAIASAEGGAPPAPGAARSGCTAGTDEECKHRQCATQCPKQASVAQQEPAQIGQGVPAAWYDEDMDSAYTAGELDGGKVHGLIPLYTHQAPQQKPLTDEQQIADALRKHGFTLVKTATGYDVMKLSPCIAHNIGEKK